MLAPDMARQLRRIQLIAKRLVTEGISGEYASAFKGRGMQFEEVREYTPGDDVRLIDWNVTARLGTPFVKVFREERELTVMLVVDVSRSMGFGSLGSRKLEQVTLLSAILATLTGQNKDHLGLVCFSNKVENFIPPKKGRTHTWQVLRSIFNFQAITKGTDFSDVFKFLRTSLKKPCLIFLISDFADAVPPTLLKQLCKKHEVIGVQVIDSLEMTLPDCGLVAFEDIETGDVMWLQSETEAATWHQVATAHNHSVKKLFRDSGSDFLQLRADENILSPIIRFLRAREAKA